MSEEEKLIYRLNLHSEGAGLSDGKTCIVYIADVKAILDLYNKEKETSHFLQSQLDIANAKIIEYEKQLDLDYVDKNYVSKDKIREKIEKLKPINFDTVDDRDYIIRILKELLEEE